MTDPEWDCKDESNIRKYQVRHWPVVKHRFSDTPGGGKPITPDKETKSLQHGKNINRRTKPTKLHNIPKIRNLN